MHQPEAAGAVANAGLLRRNGVYVAAFLMDCAMAFATIGSYYHAKERFGAGSAGLALLNLVTAGTYVICCLVLGRLSDRLGRRRMILFGTCCSALALALVAGAGSFWQLCAGMAVFWVGQSAYWPSLEADIADHSAPHELPRRLGKFNISWCLGFVVGWPIGGMVGEGLSQTAALRIGAALALLALAAYWARAFAPEPVPAAPPDARVARRAAERAVPFWAIALVLNFAAMGISNTLRSLVAQVTGEGHSALGGLYGALFFGAQVAIFVLLALWRGWHYRAAPLVAGSALGVVGAIVCGLYQREWLFASGCLLSGLGCGVAYYSSIYYSVAAASARGHRGGIHEAVLGAGGALVPFIGGILGGSAWAEGVFAWPAGVPFLFAGLAMVLAFAVGLLVYARLRLKSAPRLSPPPAEPPPASPPLPAS